MSGYTKLFSSITDSTIWQAPDPTRLVWITMLAMADQHGYVGASVPGLASRARVSVEDCITALDAFKAPDEWSRTKDYEGRRIVEADGGWILLNHAKYRAVRDEADRREQARLCMAKLREKRRKPVNTVSKVNGVSHGSPRLAQAEAEAEAEALTTSVTFGDFWSAYPRHEGKQAALKAWAKIPPSLTEPILVAVRKARQSEQWLRDGGKFIPHASSWLNGKRWEDEPPVALAPAEPDYSNLRD